MLRRLDAAVLVVDLEGKIAYANDRAKAEFLGDSDPCTSARAWDDDADLAIDLRRIAGSLGRRAGCR